MTAGSRRLSVVVALAAAVVGVSAAASPASAVRFAVKGDWGDGSASQFAITTRMCARYAKTKFAFTLTTGDNFYPSGTSTEGKFAKPEKCLIDLGVPYRAVWGNHDAGGSSTGTVLKTPARWYTFVSGPIRFVMLDANQPSNRSQLTFLSKTLAAETARPVIVAYHQGTRTAGLHEPQIVQQKLWEPLFLKYKVKLVLQGHNHLYERIVYKGITYVTSGGGGQANLYPCSRKAIGLVLCSPTHHFLLVEATRSKIGVQAITTTGAVLDHFRIALTPPPA